MSDLPASESGARVPLVELRDISVSFGGLHAVRDVTLDLYAGEVVGLVGGNGAGKSTLMHTLSGAHPADSGEILINGELVAIRNPRDARMHGVEVIYQKLALADNIDAAGNVFLGRELHSRTGSLDDSAMASATHKVMQRLNPRFTNLKTAVKSLSGGQRQSVAIARAVHFNAKILIMDEPTAALGVPEQRKVRELIERLKEQAVGVIFISHNLVDIFAVADRILVLRRGRAAGERRTADTDHDEIVKLMVGAEGVAA